MRSARRLVLFAAVTLLLFMMVEPVIPLRDVARRSVQRVTTPDTDNRPVITTDEELFAFVEHTWGIHIPDVQVCENHSTPARAFAEAYFARAPMSVWMASRGFGGKSHLLALLTLTEAVTLPANANILGGSGIQSQRVLEHMAAFWMYKDAPRSLLASEPAKKETRLKNGAKIEALMASQRSVRGPHPQRLRLDEIDELDLALFDASMGQTLSKNGIKTQTVMSSTRQYTNGTMATILQRAAEKNWPVHEWCYRESMQPHGWLSPEDVAQKQTEVTTAMWNAEYELQEPSPGSRAIQPDKVAAMFKAELGEFAGDLHEYIEIEAPVPGAKYSTGADWARKQDYTEIITFRIDVNPARLVAFLRTGRLDWPIMVGFYNSRVQRYPGQAFHDGTGIGDVVSSLFTVPATGVIMVGRARADLLTNYIAAIEHGEIEAPLIRSLKSEHQYASHEDVYASGDGHHLPDGIAAGALAWMGNKFKPWTEDEMARLGSNTISPETFSPQLLEALRLSGVDISAFTKPKE
jgi:hypothetical protein